MGWNSIENFLSDLDFHSNDQLVTDVHAELYNIPILLKVTQEKINGLIHSTLLGGPGGTDFGYFRFPLYRGWNGRDVSVVSVCVCVCVKDFF